MYVSKWALAKMSSIPKVLITQTQISTATTFPSLFFLIQGWNLKTQGGESLWISLQEGEYWPNCPCRSPHKDMRAQYTHARALTSSVLSSSLSELFRLEGGMAAPRSFFISLCGLYLLLYFPCGSTTSGTRRANQDRCGFKVKHRIKHYPWCSATFR